MSRLVLEKTNDFGEIDHPKLAVILIHGIASDSSTFNEASEYFRSQPELESVRFITFDLLGAGRSRQDDELEYTYDEQLEALHNSISDLELGDTPVVLVGHSLGTFIVTRYAATYDGAVRKLILISPPIFTEDDFRNPVFTLGMEVFKNAVSRQHPDILQTKSFNNSMNNIVLDKTNYTVLSKLRSPAVLIYGDEDQLIASYNMPGILKENPEKLQAVETKGRHGVTKDKYTEVAKVLIEILQEQA